MDALKPYRDANGQLAHYAWPGGYPLYYLTRDGLTVCPQCANRDVDQSQEPVAADTNWEDPALTCDDCEERIPSAYAEDETLAE